MADPFDPKTHDWAVLQQPPQSQEQPTVPIPEEFRLGDRTMVTGIWRSRLTRGWKVRPDISIAGQRQISLTGGVAYAPVYTTYELPVSTTVEIPDLSVSGTISQTDRIYLVSFAAEVGGDEDPDLAQVEIRYRQTDEQGNVTIESRTGENSRRMRSFWCLVLAQSEISAQDFIDNLEVPDPQNFPDERHLVVKNKDIAGFVQSSMRVFAHDSNFLVDASYHVYPNSVELLPTVWIRRVQEYENKGYVWGKGGEGNFLPEFHILPAGERVTSITVDQQAKSRMLDVFAGKPGPDRAYNRAVLNLTSGVVGGNPGRPGIPAGTFNGSVALANSQRVSFTNEKSKQKVGCQLVTASSFGDGNATVSFNLAANVPLGTRFSPNREEHRIFTLEGKDVTERGRFLNLGQSGSLQWIAESNPDVVAGQDVFFQPTIIFPAGSGFTIPFHECEGVWLNATNQISDVREAYKDDLDSYQDPIDNNFIVVVGSERGALHYIYKKISVTTDSNGIATIPSNEYGCFAFIEGVNGRIDLPFHKGLQPETSYNALVYYPPRSGESWQLQFKYCEYQGLQDPSLLDGAEIVGRPRLFLHTQGGGQSAFFGDPVLRYRPISMELPYPDNVEDNFWEVNTSVSFPGEAFSEPISFREVESVFSGTSSALISPGKIIARTDTNTTHLNSMQVRLTEEGTDIPFGAQVPRLGSGEPCQAVLGFPIQYGDRNYLVIATKVLSGGSIVLDSDQGTGIDVFPL